MSTASTQGTKTDTPQTCKRVDGQTDRQADRQTEPRCLSVCLWQMGQASQLSCKERYWYMPGLAIQHVVQAPTPQQVQELPLLVGLHPCEGHGVECNNLNQCLIWLLHQTRKSRPRDTAPHPTLQVQPQSSNEQRQHGDRQHLKVILFA